MTSRTARATSGACVTSGGMKMTITESTHSSARRTRSVSAYCSAVAEAIMSIGFSDARLGRKDPPQRRDRLVGQLSDVEPGGLAASAARMPGPPAFVRIATRRPSRQRLVRQQVRHVKHLFERVDADHAGLLEQRIDGDVHAGQCAGVRRSGPRAGGRAVRSSPRRSASLRRCAAPGGRTSAGSRTTPGTAGSRPLPGPAPSTGSRRCRRRPPCSRLIRTSRGRCASSSRDRAGRGRAHRSARAAQRCRTAGRSARTWR